MIALVSSSAVFLVFAALGGLLSLAFVALLRSEAGLLLGPGGTLTEEGRRGERDGDGVRIGGPWTLAVVLGRRLTRCGFVAAALAAAALAGLAALLGALCGFTLGELAMLRATTIGRRW